MKTNYLLPHSYQRIGLWALYSAIALFVIYFFACLTIAFSDHADTLLRPDSMFVNSIYFANAILICIGLMLIAFSMEKHEDEMIAAIRKDSVATAAYVIFLFYMTVTIASQILEFRNFSLGIDDSSSLSGLTQTIVQPIIIFAIYEIIFRIKLAKSKRGLEHEE